VRIVALALIFVASTARADDADEPGTVQLAAGERIDHVLTRKVESVPVLVVAPRSKPKAIVLLFSGGNGRLGLTDDGIAHGADNFVVRTRARYADAGIVAVVVDVPSDHRKGVGDFRVSDEAVEDVRELVAWAQDTWPKTPVWLVGTSRGTLSAASAVARGVAVDGLVLTSSVTAGKKAKLGDVATDAIRVRTLMVHHAHDACSASPLAGAQQLAATMHATWKTFDGGAKPTGDACSSSSRHGFLGLDAEVTAAIIDFIGARP
jgi:alpha/beta superfamily hydrolase